MPEKKSREWYLSLVAAAIVLTLIVLAVIYRDKLEDLQGYGYFGVFVVCILAGGTVIVPVPGLPMVFTMGGILTPYYVGLAAGLGEGVGVLTAYMAGRGGRKTFETRFYSSYIKIEGWMKQRGTLFLFLSSSVLNPFFVLIGATAGAMRFPLWKFFFACCAGKTVKGMWVAYLGSWGLPTILRWLGISV
jgi:membrane protein YqaA with SNARE-associated domain